MHEKNKHNNEQMQNLQYIFDLKIKNMAYPSNLQIDSNSEDSDSDSESEYHTPAEYSEEEIWIMLFALVIWHGLSSTI